MLPLADSLLYDNWWTGWSYNTMLIMLMRMMMTMVATPQHNDWLIIMIVMVMTMMTMIMVMAMTMTMKMMIMALMMTMMRVGTPQGCEMSQIWQIYLCKNSGKWGKKYGKPHSFVKWRSFGVDSTNCFEALSLNHFYLTAFSAFPPRSSKLS